MLKYTVKRLAQSLVTILLIATIVFLLMRCLPTDYYFTEEQLMKFTEEQKYAALEAAGLTDPIGTQLMHFYNDLLHLLQCLRISIPDILRCQNHDSSGNKFHIFPRIKHPCQIIHRGIRIGSTHALDKSRDRIIVIISRLIVVDDPLLNALTGHIQCNVNDPILTPIRGQNSKFNGGQRCTRISVCHVSQKLQRIIIHLCVVGTHALFRIIDRPKQQCTDILRGKFL